MQEYGIEGSSLLAEEDAAPSVSKNERERIELIYLAIGKKWASFRYMGKATDPVAGPLPQHLKEAKSLRHEKKTTAAF